MNLLDEATFLVTAFPKFSALEAACKRGYVPTLISVKEDSRDERKAKAVLTSVLTANGFSVRDR